MVFDLHNDLLTARTSSEIEEEIAIYRNAGVRGILLAVWTTKLGLAGDDLARYSVSAPFFVRTAIEDLGAVAVADYDGFFSLLKPAYASLTWNGENILAGGTGFEAPLTTAGRRALAAMERAGVALDLSHLSDKAFFDALDAAQGRVLVTHTASRALAGHPRNLTDEMAGLVASRGGLIGVAAVPNFLDAALSYGQNCARKDYLRHIAHLAETVGTDRVAIGTDFNGADYFPQGMSRYEDFAALRFDMEAAGFTKKEIDQIFYENAELFFGFKES